MIVPVDSFYNYRLAIYLCTWSDTTTFLPGVALIYKVQSLQTPSTEEGGGVKGVPTIPCRPAATDSSFAGLTTDTASTACFYGVPKTPTHSQECTCNLPSGKFTEEEW